MNASSPKPDAKPSRPAEDASVPDWLEALAAGSCTQKEFLGKVESLESDDPEVPWEVLSLLDQYLRREIISRDLYVSLKARLQQRYMGFGSGSPALEHTDVQTVSSLEPDRPLPAATRPVPTAAHSDGRPQIGDVLRGRYQLVDVLRKDPPGALFEAIDQFKVEVPDVSHRVAIEVFGEASRRDPGVLQRICGLQSLSHPAIERVFEVDEDGGALLLITESLSGASLQQLGEAGGARLTLPASQRIIQNVASALAYAHVHNVFHGDVRPDNVFVTDIGDVRLRGFEISARDVPANPKGDRLAFAWFAYELLSSLRNGWSGDRNSRLRKPPGVTREQWRALRATMTGREGNPGNLLAMFAGPNIPGPVVLRDGERARARRMETRDWMASGVVAAVLAVAGYFIVTRGVLNPPVASAQPVATIAPAPQVSTPAKPVLPPEPAAETASPTPEPTETTPTAPTAPAPPIVAAPRPSRAQIDLPSGIETVSGDEPVARIRVRRRGGLTGEVSFLWWTESGSARVDQDFRAITPRTATIEGGANGVELLVPLMANPSRRQPRTFYVKIDEPDSGAALGDQTLMQVSIVPPGYVEAPAER